MSSRPRPAELRRLCRFSLALCVALSALDGHAQERREHAFDEGIAPSQAPAGARLRIAVIRDARAAPASITRLYGELTTLGLQVIEIEVEDASNPDVELDGLARGVQAVAAARIVSDLGIEVWIGDRNGARTLLRKFVVGPGKAVDEVVALRASELVRATLSRLELLPTPARAPVSQTRSQPRALSAELPSPWVWSAQMGAAVSYSPGGTGPTAQLAVGTRVIAMPALSFGAVALLPIVASTLREPEGEAEIRPFLLGADAQYRLWASSAWSARAGAGISGVYLAVAGKASAAYGDRDEALFVAAPYARVTLSAELHRNLVLSTDVMEAVALTEPRIEFGQRTVAHWGRPLSIVALLVELRLW